MKQETQLRAGAAETDITPAMDIQIAGDIGRRRPVNEIRERIYAKILAEMRPQDVLRRSLLHHAPVGG